MRLCLAACDPACDHPPAPHVPLHASPSAPSAGESTSTQPSTLAQLAQIQRQMQQMVRAHAHVLTRLHEIETEHEIDERLLRSHEIGESAALRARCVHSDPRGEGRHSRHRHDGARHGRDRVQFQYTNKQRQEPHQFASQTRNPAGPVVELKLVTTQTYDHHCSSTPRQGSSSYRTTSLFLFVCLLPRTWPKWRAVCQLDLCRASLRGPVGQS